MFNRPLKEKEIAPVEGLVPDMLVKIANILTTQDLVHFFSSSLLLLQFAAMRKDVWHPAINRYFPFINLDAFESGINQFELFNRICRTAYAPLQVDDLKKNLKRNIRLFNAIADGDVAALEENKLSLNDLGLNASNMLVENLWFEESYVPSDVTFAQSLVDCMLKKKDQKINDFVFHVVSTSDELNKSFYVDLENNQSVRQYPWYISKYAILCRQPVAFLEALKAPDFLIETMNFGGNETALHLAARSGSIEHINYFLEKGLIIDARTLWNMRTEPSYQPLDYAAKYGHKDAAELLIARGALSRTVTRCGVFYDAVKDGNLKLIEEIVAIKGMQIDERSHNNQTLLCQALEAGFFRKRNYSQNAAEAHERHIKIIEILTNAGADIHAPQGDPSNLPSRDTPFLSAIKNCHTEALKVFLKQHPEAKKMISDLPVVYWSVESFLKIQNDRYKNDHLITLENVSKLLKHLELLIKEGANIYALPHAHLRSVDVFSALISQADTVPYDINCYAEQLLQFFLRQNQAIFNAPENFWSEKLSRLDENNSAEKLVKMLKTHIQFLEKIKKYNAIWNDQISDTFSNIQNDQSRRVMLLLNAYIGGNSVFGRLTYFATHEHYSVVKQVITECSRSDITSAEILQTLCEKTQSIKRSGDLNAVLCVIYKMTGLDYETFEVAQSHKKFSFTG